MQETQNGSGRQVVADLHFKNLAINEKLFGKSKHKRYVAVMKVVF